MVKCKFLFTFQSSYYFILYCEVLCTLYIVYCSAFCYQISLQVPAVSWFHSFCYYSSCAGQRFLQILWQNLRKLEKTTKLSDNHCKYLCRHQQILPLESCRICKILYHCLKQDSQLTQRLKIVCRNRKPLVKSSWQYM